jgi:UDP-N-acetylmuramyl pentapeptide phosphotransferase/UDP-N-acetylglucosamine-1-phosphate transferase
VLGIGKLPEVISIGLTYITIIVIINAFNLIDGVDGLAGSLGVLSMTSFGIYFIMADLPFYAAMSFAMAGGLLAFLMYNFNPAKIFMGDSGSLMLGLINSVLVIKFISVADSAVARMPISGSAAIGFAILIVPLLDTLRVFSIRIAQRRSPFAPDRNHIHHLLLDKGLSPRYVTISCVGLNLAFIVLAYLGQNLGSTILISGMSLLFFASIGALARMGKPESTTTLAGDFQRNKEPVAESATKVVALKSEPVAAEQ